MATKLQLIRKQFPPPDGYRYKFPQDGITVKCNTYDGWRSRILQHCSYNDYPIPSMEDCEDQLCRILPPGLCQYPDGALPAFFIDARVSVEDVLHGTRVLGEWMLRGMPLVERSVAEERGKTCAACYANLHIPGCAPCVGLASLVTEVAGGQPLEADAQLEGKMCGYCKCASRANVWVDVKISRHGVTPEMLAAMPEEWCWKKLEILALDAA